MGKAAVFIDGAYYEKVGLEFGRPPVDLVKMSDHVAAPSERLRTYYYDSLPWVGNPPDPADQVRYAGKQRYFAALRHNDGFEVREGRIQRIGTPPNVKFNQKLVDVKLSVELVRLAWGGQIDHAILFAGDSDFVPAVEAAKDAGVIVKLLYARQGNVTAHDELIMAADRRVKVDAAFLAQFPRV